MVKMKEKAFFAGNLNSQRINSIYQIEMLETKDIGTHVKKILLPNLLSSYRQAKNYLPNTCRRNIYTLKKQMADLIEDLEFVKISNSEDIEGYCTKHESLFSVMESLNLIYFFCGIIRPRLNSYQDHRTIYTLKRITKLISSIQKEIQNVVDIDQNCSKISI